jgi:chromosomal replication initiation ATPase DnaA
MARRPVEDSEHRIVSDKFGCSKEKIREKGRKNNKARSLAIYLARNLSGATCSEFGDFFDGVSGAARWHKGVVGGPRR